MPRVAWTAKATEKGKAEYEQHERETQTPILKKCHDAHHFAEQ